MRPLSVSPPTEVPFCNCRILTRLSPFKTVPLVSARLSLHFAIIEIIKERRMVAVRCNVFFFHEIQISRRQWFSRTDFVLTKVPSPSTWKKTNLPICWKKEETREERWAFEGDHNSDRLELYSELPLVRWSVSSACSLSTFVSLGYLVEVVDTRQGTKREKKNLKVNGQ